MEIEGTGTAQLDHRSAAITKEALSDHPAYSELVISSTERCYSTRDFLQQTRGRKVCKEFEAEVWGKLMPCWFEYIVIREGCVFYIQIQKKLRYFYM